MDIKGLTDEERYNLLIEKGYVTILDDSFMHAKTNVTNFMEKLRKSDSDLKVQKLVTYEPDILQATYLIYIVEESLSQEEEAELYTKYCELGKKVRETFLKLYPEYFEI
ncbi:hypothetical protein [Candidatus Enterococcus ikei]|uniref:Uncharacterized protein n=1 Tax=Candidatus Enterococcus ikei TaxID=2815326 RepID=A0ABS3GWG7_9ENTE|nr:hypothetical protein [Enterococcus sp. DIV0869a]MBO0439609.1 hypothetical protein [Enterococcus sp. DIV0869a]